MTARFKEEIIPWLFKWEGTTYENDPDDAGGETKYGIDKRSHSHVNIRDLTAGEAASIYWTEYLNLHCDQYPPPMDWIFFNACVNCGIDRAVKLMRGSAANPAKFLDLQNMFYRTLAHSRPSSMKYLKGWLARTEDLRKICGLV